MGRDRHGTDLKRNFFTYRNLGRDYIALEEDLRRGTPTAVFGLSATNKHLIAALTQSHMLYVCADALSAQRACAAIAALSGRKCVLLTAKDEVLLYKDALSKDAVYRRLSALYEIMNGAEYFVCDILSAMQLVPASLPSFTLVKGEDADPQNVVQTLINYGYTREYAVNSKGSFALRGDILDIYPINTENPLRVDFFGDNVERIRFYDAVSGDRLEEAPSFTFIAASDCMYTQEDAAAVIRALDADLKKVQDPKAYVRASGIRDDIREKMGFGVPFSGGSFVMPLLRGTRTLAEILPKDTLVVFDECKTIYDSADSLYREHTERVRELAQGGEVFPFSRGQLLDTETLFEGLKRYRVLALQTFLQSMAFFNPLRTYNMRSAPCPSYLGNFPQFIQDIQNWRRNGYRVLAFTGSAERTQHLGEELMDSGLPVEPLPDIYNALRGVTLCSDDIGNGLMLHETKTAIVGNADLYTKTVTKHIRRRRGDLFLTPEIGDYCVHEKHGVGRITGTKKIESTEGTKEYISIEYACGDTLYVPVEQMDVLSKYVGEENPPLARLGGGEFQRLKEKARKSIKQLAFDLKALYAERSKQHGYAFPENVVMMEEFEDSFEYEETPDQLSSIEEVKADMCSDKVMDRLLCGDVGFGKTEVAFRAVYLCVLGGKQAALMCPSTILSEQHYNTAVDRFREFGVRVDKLNRFKTPAEQAKTIEALKNGEIDFIIGTHRLLSEDVGFKDLGLLVLDEEQRFGVAHKEKIKNMKKDVDCLTMTATPIPRTLHMSLAGIRDISTINTPPRNRLPVQTYVVEESDVIIRDACIRELSRGGQVFILYNRVESIARYAEKIKAIVPEAEVCYAHGRMDKKALEDSVFSFYAGLTNVLVTTTIIENGIDLPNANTLIVIDADRLGIAQLYQLRGRVGRSTRLAQAYFTFKPDKVLTSEATERLKAIMRFTELGSGYKIAMRDLEIRGAGNVLGAEQHGHMDKIGYELYSKILKEELTGENQFSAELDIRATAYIPESYIASNAGRMDCYKQIAEIRSNDDYRRVCLSIEDNYGPMPDSVLNLLVIAVLKSYAAKFNIKKIGVDSKGGYLELPGINALQSEGLGAALDKYRSAVSLSMERAPLIVFHSGTNPTRTMIGMTNFLKFAANFT